MTKSVQIESTCRRQFHCGSTVPFFYDRVENIVRKGENANYQLFHLFPNCLQKAYFQCHENLGLFRKEISLQFILGCVKKIVGVEKILVTNTFLYFPIMFSKSFFFSDVNNPHFVVNSLQNNPRFPRPWKRYLFENNVENGENAGEC